MGAGPSAGDVVQRPARPRPGTPKPARSAALLETAGAAHARCGAQRGRAAARPRGALGRRGRPLRRGRARDLGTRRGARPPARCCGSRRASTAGWSAPRGFRQGQRVAASVAVRRILAVPRGLREHRRAQRRYAQSVRLERTDLPSRHVGHWEPALAVRDGDCVVIELVRSQGHAAKTSTTRFQVIDSPVVAARHRRWSRTRWSG
jgi:hypothetical protein